MELVKGQEVEFTEDEWNTFHKGEVKDIAVTYVLVYSKKYGHARCAKCHVRPVSIKPNFTHKNNK